jgi:hypothetical protein
MWDLPLIAHYKQKAPQGARRGRLISPENNILYGWTGAPSSDAKKAAEAASIAEP